MYCCIYGLDKSLRTFYSDESRRIHNGMISPSILFWLHISTTVEQKDTVKKSVPRYSILLHSSCYGWSVMDIVWGTGAPGIHLCVAILCLCSLSLPLCHSQMLLPQSNVVVIVKCCCHSQMLLPQSNVVVVVIQMCRCSSIQYSQTIFFHNIEVIMNRFVIC